MKLLFNGYLALYYFSRPY